jgi:hypothetical protein
MQSARHSSRRWLAVAALLMLTACAAEGPVKSHETLDENTGMTLAALAEPMAFVETGVRDLLAPDMQPSVLYVGPVEWDRSGDYSYSLWVEVAPGVDGHRIDDIRARGALTLELDDGSVVLSALQGPVKAMSPYASIEPVGQTAYFAIDMPLLKRMAASRKIALKVRAGDLSLVDFVARQETRPELRQFMVDRGLADD